TATISSIGMPAGEWQEVEVEATVGPEPGTGLWQTRGQILGVGPFQVGEMTLHRDQPLFNSDRRSPETAITTLRNVGQSQSAGGPLGVTRVAGEPAGIEEHYAWDRLDNPSLPQALKAVADTPGGPDLWFQPGRRLHHSKRAGTDRHDLA